MTDDFDDVFVPCTRYEVYGRIAKGNTLKFVKFKGEKNEGIPEIDESVHLDTYDSLDEAKQKVLSCIEEAQINDGFVVDTETDKIVWQSRGK
jgi:hypothetical protein